MTNNISSNTSDEWQVQVSRKTKKNNNNKKKQGKGGNKYQRYSTNEQVLNKNKRDGSSNNKYHYASTNKRKNNKEALANNNNTNPSGGNTGRGGNKRNNKYNNANSRKKGGNGQHSRLRESALLLDPVIIASPNLAERNKNLTISNSTSLLHLQLQADSLAVKAKKTVSEMSDTTAVSVTSTTTLSSNATTPTPTTPNTSSSTLIQPSHHTSNPTTITKCLSQDHGENEVGQKEVTPKNESLSVHTNRSTSSSSSSITTSTAQASTCLNTKSTVTPSPTPKPDNTKKILEFNLKNFTDVKPFIPKFMQQKTSPPPSKSSETKKSIPSTPTTTTSKSNLQKKSMTTMTPSSTKINTYRSTNTTSNNTKNKTIQAQPQQVLTPPSSQKPKEINKLIRLPPSELCQLQNGMLSPELLKQYCCQATNQLQDQTSIKHLHEKKTIELEKEESTEKINHSTEAVCESATEASVTKEEITEKSTTTITAPTRSLKRKPTQEEIKKVIVSKKENSLIGSAGSSPKLIERKPIDAVITTAHATSTISSPTKTPEIHKISNGKVVEVLESSDESESEEIEYTDSESESEETENSNGLGSRSLTIRDRIEKEYSNVKCYSDPMEQSMCRIKPSPLKRSVSIQNLACRKTANHQLLLGGGHLMTVTRTNTVITQKQPTRLRSSKSFSWLKSVNMGMRSETDGQTIETTINTTLTTTHTDALYTNLSSQATYPIVGVPFIYQQQQQKQSNSQTANNSISQDSKSSQEKKKNGLERVNNGKLHSSTSLPNLMGKFIRKITWPFNTSSVAVATATTAPAAK